jgi:hypothetical protein
VELFAILRDYARGAATFDADVIDIGARADVDALTQGHTLQGLREAAHGAAQVGPGAALAGGHAHGVVELDVSGAGIARATEGANETEGAGGRLHDV